VHPPLTLRRAKPAPAEAQGTWYIVVEGEQVGPLAEPDIAARLGRGEITGETLVWKEVLPTGCSCQPSRSWRRRLPSSDVGCAVGLGPAGRTCAIRRDSARMRTYGSAKEAARAAAPGEDIFSKPAQAASGAADLFASPPGAFSPAASDPSASASSGFRLVQPLPRPLSLPPVPRATAQGKVI